MGEQITENKKIVSNLINNYTNSNKEEIIITCIGTPRNMGDSIGPLVGTKLTKLNYDIPIYGTMDYPIHAMNLNEKIKDIYIKHPKAFIIAIDACISYTENIGKILFKNSAIRPGYGVGKRLQEIGDVSIIGIVSDNAKDVLNNNIEQKTVDEISENITSNIMEFFNNITLREIAI